MPQPPLTLLPWLDLFFLGPQSLSTQNLTSALSLHPAILQQGQSCLLVPAKSAEIGCASRTQAAPPQWLSRKYPLPNHWADWSTSLSWSPTLKCSGLLSSWLHVSYSFWDLGCKYADLHLAELGQTDRSGPQTPQPLADTVVPTGTQGSAAQHSSSLCEEQRGCSHPEGPCQRGHAVSPTLSPTKRSKTQVSVV